LLEWYASSGRDLPWRRTRDPYAVLVSEMMLQQTQVERVIPKWHAWLEQFPTLADLARASRADAIRAWQGLGYNLRAVRLHDIACQVVVEFGSALPRTLDGLLRLKGIGRYTAGAVACFAYGLPVSMVDTNVRRVLGRVFVGESLTASALRTLADEVIPFHAAYEWNQGLMDLGATICRVDAPLCLVCPLMTVCSSVGQVSPRAARPRSVSHAPFVGSSRYVRGRVLDALRTLPAGEGMAIDVLAASIAQTTDGQRLRGLLERLMRDGLVIQTTEGRVRLPD
jgi:A/G-specific adenine glycosylase